MVGVLHSPANTRTSETCVFWSLKLATEAAQVGVFLSQIKQEQAWHHRQGGSVGAPPGVIGQSPSCQAWDSPCHWETPGHLAAPATGVLPQQMSQPSSCFVLMDLRLPFPAQRHGAAGTQVRGSCHSEMWSWDASSSLRPKHSPSPTERHQAAGPGEAPSILSGGTNGSLLAQIMKQIKEHSRGPEN